MTGFEPNYQAPNTNGYGTPGAPTTASGLTIASLILGLLCFIPPLGLVAIILGVIALRQTGNAENRKSGGGLAVAGIVLGAVGMIIIPLLALMIGILLPAMGAARRTARQIHSTTQTRGIHQSMVIDAQSNNQYFVGLDRDGELVEPRVAGRFQYLLEQDYYPGHDLLNTIAPRHI